MVKVWAFEFNHIQGRYVDAAEYENPDRVQQTFDDTLARLKSTETSGFEGVFFSEHHFGYGLSPAPNLLVAALARETTRIRIGVLGNVLPFHQPWRLAEDLGVLDYLTHGRLEIGMSSGVPPEFPIVNINPAQSRAMYAEFQDFLEVAAKDTTVTFKGEHYDFEEIFLMPRLRPEARRRRWVTLYSEETARRAAAREHKICAAFTACERMRSVFAAYHAEADKLGIRTSPDDIGIRRQVLVCETDAQAAELDAEVMEAQKARARLRFKPVLDRATRRGDASGASVGQGVKQTGTIDAASTKPTDPKDPFANLVSLEDEFIRGSPETVAERIIDQCRRTGAGNVMAHHSPALERQEVIDMFGRQWPKVIKILTRADVHAT